MREVNMYIMTATKSKQIINSDFVERFVVAEKPDTILVLASYNQERQPVTMARYRDAKEADNALGELMMALAEGQQSFTMPDSLLYFEEHIKKDARTKRKGGS